MKRGFFKIMRCDFDTASYCKLELIGMHTYLKSRVNLKARKWQGVMIYPGQFVSSMGKLADDTGKSIKTVKIMLGKLKADGLIKTENRANRFTIISICKPHLYGLQPCMTGLTNELRKYPTKYPTKYPPDYPQSKECNKYIFRAKKFPLIEKLLKKDEQKLFIDWMMVSQEKHGNKHGLSVDQEIKALIAIDENKRIDSLKAAIKGAWKNIHEKTPNIALKLTPGNETKKTEYKTQIGGME